MSAETIIAFPEVRDFVSAVRARYGTRLSGLYLFGSRARGDHRRESDYDIAIVLYDANGALWREQDRLSDIAYDAMLAHGIHIQPFPFAAADWSSKATRNDLLDAARSDAVELGAG